MKARCIFLSQTSVSAYWKGQICTWLVRQVWNFACKFKKDGECDKFSQIVCTRHLRPSLFIQLRTYIWPRSQCQWGPVGSWTGRPAALQLCCSGRRYLLSAWTSHPELLTEPDTRHSITLGSAVQTIASLYWTYHLKNMVEITEINTSLQSFCLFKPWRVFVSVLCIWDSPSPQHNCRWVSLRWRCWFRPQSAAYRRRSGWVCQSVAGRGRCSFCNARSDSSPLREDRGRDQYC